MTGTNQGTDAVPPWLLATAAMFSVQLSSALSVDLISSIGSAGTAWLRLTFGALVFLLIARPPLRSVRRRDVPALLGLGVATGVMAIAFLAALERIPLGTAVAIEFLGPLTVAAVRSHTTRALAWPALALAGVVLVTRPWDGQVNLAGVGFATLAAICWGTYILLTQRVGDRFSGIRGLSLTIPVAAVTAAVVGVPQAAGHLTIASVTAAAGLALLLPVLPFALEMLALRRMTHAAFGTLMAVEPGIGVVLGLLVLHQAMTPLQLIGVVLVVIAGGAAQRASAPSGSRSAGGAATAVEQHGPAVGVRQGRAHERDAGLSGSRTPRPGSPGQPLGRAVPRSSRRGPRTRPQRLGTPRS